jgi:hypothetical protein
VPMIAYKSVRFSPGSLALIARANKVIAEYSAQELRLTLRQLYYQFVSRDWIANRQTEYKRLGSIVNDARIAGLIDWDAIEDRTRGLRRVATWGSPAEIIGAVAYQYREDLWATQRNYVECWVEKEALSGVIGTICDELRVPHFACKGYTSQSEMWEAGQRRLAGALARGQDPVILHLGDHDPSGIDMTRDIADRLSMFAHEHIEVERLALNFDQIERYQPPPNPAKMTDSRFNGYANKYGDQSWELDALDPKTLRELIRSAVLRRRDEGVWKRAVAKERAQRRTLERVHTQWSDVANLVGGSKRNGRPPRSTAHAD